MTSCDERYIVAICVERARERERERKWEGMERLYHMYVIVSNVPEWCVCTSKIKMLYYV